MPWPMRFGPPPRMTIFCRSVGSASQAGVPKPPSYVLYMYGVADANSPAQVSIRL